MAADTEFSLDGVGDEVPASSPLAHLRERVTKARERATFDFPVEVDEQLTLVFRFRAMGFEEQEHVTRKTGRNAKADLNKVGASMLAWTNVGVFAEDEDSKLVSIDPEGSCFIDPDTDQIVGEPVTLSSKRMFELLGVETASTLDVLKALVPKELYVQRMVVKVTEFSTGDSQDSLLGN